MKIKKYLISLTLINFLIVLIYGIINYKLSKKISTINEKFFITQQKEILIFDISKNILKLENLIYQATILGVNHQILNYYKSQIETTIKNINFLLKLLQNGGEYTQQNIANFVNTRIIKKKIIIKKSEFSPEINDIKTKLTYINNNILNIFSKIKKRNKNIKDHTEIRREIKLLPSIFDRMIENINRYLAITEKELSTLKNEKEKLLSNYIITQFIFLILALIVNILILIYIFKDLQKLYNELEYRLYYDPLTKLKNRIALEEDIKKGSGLIIIDIDDFSNINEMYGLKVGDELLIEFANFLNKKEKYCYRIGSDEFAILLPKVTNIKKYAKNLYSNIYNTPIYLPSIGITLHSLNVKMGLAIKNDLIKNATFALKIAKEKNIPIYKVTQKDIKKEKEKISYTMTWTQKIKEGLKNDNFVPFIQPIVDSKKRDVKYEVLLRLKDGEKYIPPFFLDIAKKNRLYHEISEITFKKAINFNKQISFNISYLDIENPNMQKLIFSTLKNSDLDITFEILEDESIKDYKLFINFIKKVKDLGAKVAIDDFGTGYSNFVRILEINPDLVKIDGSLIKDIHLKENQNIVKAIVSFAKDSNIKTVAEFVENEEIFEVCKNLGIDYFQGYYFSAPYPITSPPSL